MLALTRNLLERIVLRVGGRKIATVILCDIKSRTKARIGVDALPEITVHREEIDRMIFGDDQPKPADDSYGIQAAIGQVVNRISAAVLARPGTEHAATLNRMADDLTRMQDELMRLRMQEERPPGRDPFLPGPVLDAIAAGNGAEVHGRTPMVAELSELEGAS